MIVVGIDPGLKGALAFYNGTRLEIVDMPTIKVTRNSVDAVALARTFGRDITYDHALLERVGARPGNGGSSMFNFGEGFGMIQGVLATLDIPLTLVTPAVWKKALKVPADKSGARGRATQLMPRHAHNWPLIKHDGRAEAALLALYGFNLMMGPVTEPETW